MLIMALCDLLEIDERSDPETESMAIQISENPPNHYYSKRGDALTELASAQN